MPIKSYTYHYYEDKDGNSFPIPFEMDDYSILLHIQGDKAILGCLAHDEYPDDPIDNFDEGGFHQFNDHYVHSTPRPDVDEFKRIVRSNPGRVVLIHERSGGQGYFADDTALGIHDTKTDAILEIENADGYYIAPDDVTDPAKYAKGVMEEYSAWCEGDVWGICIWQYTKEGDEWELDEESRDECWGFFGRKYAEEELDMLFKSYVREKINEHTM